MSTTAEKTAVVKADQFTTMIAEKKQAYAGLTITSLDDKEGYKKVDAARKDFKSIRVEIEKFFKAERDTLNVAVKANLAKEKEVLALVTPLELELKAKTDVIDNEKQRIADEEAAREKAKTAARFDRINKLGLVFDGNNYQYEDHRISSVDIQTASDEKIEEFVLSVMDAKEKAAEAQRVADENKAREQAEIAAKQKAENERLAAIKAEQDKREAELKAQQDAIDKEKRELAEAKAKEEAEKQRQIDIENAKREGEEKAKREAEARAKAQADAEEKARKEAEEKAANDPDKDKLLGYVKAIAAVTMPELNGSAGKKILENFGEKLIEAVSYLEKETNKL